ncbi:MAG: transcription termination factor NusA [Armatimonadetes bacterium]|nr:transcription termination factor NusA [Armatimonadota bacterium]
MRSDRLFEILQQVERERELDRETLLDVLCRALKVAYQRQFVGKERRQSQKRKTTPKLLVYLDEDNQEIKVFIKKRVVEEVRNAGLEISLEDARRIKSDARVDELVEIELPLERFTRSAMQIARDEFLRQVQSICFKRICEKFETLKGEIIKAEVRRVDKRGNVYLYADGAELFLPIREQIKTDTYRVGEKLRVYIKDVRFPDEHRKRGSKRGEVHPESMIIVSRADRELVRKLFEHEIPDVRDGVVKVRAVARDAGTRSKVAVSSDKPNVDPVGACIGQQGKRISSIVSELRGEQIDVVAWSDDPAEFLINALSPAKIDYVILNEDGRSATVIVQTDQLPTAIGREGKNVSLAAKLTGWRIDIRSYEHLEQLLAKPSKEVLEESEEEGVKEDEAAAELEGFGKVVPEAQAGAIRSNAAEADNG